MTSGLKPLSQRGDSAAAQSVVEAALGETTAVHVTDVLLDTDSLVLFAEAQHKARRLCQSKF